MKTMDIDTVIAVSLGLTAVEFHAMAPRCWQQVPLQIEGIEGSPPIDVGAWFVGGDPAAVVVGIMVDTVVVGRAVETWHGPDQLSYHVNQATGLIRISRSDPWLKSRLRAAFRSIEAQRPLRRSG
jgi:hypothetical protein